MKRIEPRIACVVAAMVVLSGCVTVPVGPTVAVAPGANKTPDTFAADQAECQQYASAQIAPQAYAATNQSIGTAIFTTALGAAIGGAVGGGHAAGIGAASGAALGALGGASGSGYAQLSLQQQFNVIYAQCMAAHGNHPPGFSPPPGAPPYAGPPGPYSGAPSPYSAPAGKPYYGGPGPSPYGGGPYPGTPVPPPPG